MKIENYFHDCGDEKDGAEIFLTHEEYDVFLKIFNRISRDKFVDIGLSESEIKIASNFKHLY